jgi:hypothetical protein
MSVGQALTVQVGPLANRVGAHYWNACKPSAECWIDCFPILLCADAKGGFGSMPLLGRPALVAEDAPWDGEKVTVERPPVVGVWTEDVAVRLTERSLLPLESLQRGVMCPFDEFDDGAELMRDTAQADALTEALRRWSEACDRVARVRLSYDGADGFGGVAAAVADYAWDEHAKVSVTMSDWLSSDLFFFRHW